MITAKDRDFFTTFGFLRLPGLLRDEIGWITDAFMATVEREFSTHNGEQRSSMRSCLERDERLCSILDLSQLTQAIETLLGSDWCYYSSDGNYYSGDTGWHSDSDWKHGTCIKVPLYFDDVSAGSGALRVIPGTHRRDVPGSAMRDAGRSEHVWGISGSDVPCTVLESRPGDVIAIDTNIMHAAFGGGRCRKMLALQFWSSFHTEAQYAELDHHMQNWSSSQCPLHSELLHRQAPRERRLHLRQVAARHAVHPGYAAPAWLEEVLDAESLANQPPTLKAQGA